MHEELRLATAAGDCTEFHAGYGVRECTNCRRSICDQCRSASASLCEACGAARVGPAGRAIFGSLLSFVPLAGILVASLLFRLVLSLVDATAAYADTASYVLGLWWVAIADPGGVTDVISETHRLVLHGSSWRRAVIPWSTVDRFEPVEGVRLLLAALRPMWHPLARSTILIRGRTYVLQTRPSKSRGARTYYVSLHDAATAERHYSAARR